ncbi:ABC transporter thiamine pyrophosphate-binding lipoprotein p37/Cypl [Mycoplasma enhydrae]|uniref:ABC transporter thiamine pyrophosphate-binding lipoprotein p37/Cypl n=1 Tax=Mycoplasma enhydrae TaxID=2499220 RepID=UPI00197B7290|nr:alkylphosphonate ABC transporter substrate-binidng protein [Mycoplasma enhydrae]MBN4089324.1 alkylphosphonate ABC transporter substrate-binidng protein [Mycoplasma enhydrae]MCV3733696.1 alkylphosphonate ABC transporter substrate-binidng protein [Mycoplasma enhydrae]
MKRLNLFLSGTIPFSIPLTAISCQTERLSFSVNQPWNGKRPRGFFEAIVDSFQKSTNEKRVSYKINFIEENNDSISLLKKGSTNIAIVTTPLFIQQRDRNIVPIIQTMTRAFKFDLNINDLYSDGTNADRLRIIAKNAQDLFAKKPYKEWTNDGYKWNGSIYEYFYDTKNVEYYRGLIMIQGTGKQRKKIKEAWENKDWNSFRNFGIVTGKETSGSKYILQEALFKKHFNKKDNSFQSFAIDKKNNSEKYTTGRPRDIGKGSLKKYHIVFDELGSFGYTHNKKNNDKYSPEDKDSKIEFLTVTEPLKYNVIAVSKKSFFDNEITILKNAIIDVWKHKKDNYGPLVGFNEYKAIEDIQKEVIDPYEKIFK